MTPGQRTQLDLYAICERHGTTLERLKQVRRVKDDEITAIREVCRYLKDVKKWNTRKIGVFMNRDHGTIRHHLGGK